MNSIHDNNQLSKGSIHSSSQDSITNPTPIGSNRERISNNNHNFQLNQKATNLPETTNSQFTNFNNNNFQNTNNNDHAQLSDKMENVHMVNHQQNNNFFSASSNTNNFAASSDFQNNNSNTDFSSQSFENQLSSINQAFENNWSDLERTIVTLNILRRLDPKHGHFISMVANSSIFPRYQFALSGNGGVFPKPYMKDRERACNFIALSKIAYQFSKLIQLNEIANLLPFLPEEIRKQKDGEKILEKYLQIINQGVMWVLETPADKCIPKHQLEQENDFLSGLKIATNVLSLAIQHPAFSREDKCFLSGLYQKIKTTAAQESQNISNQKIASHHTQPQRPPPPPPPQQHQQQLQMLPPSNNNIPATLLPKNFGYPAQIQHWLKVHRLHKYYDVIVMYPYSELLKINAGTLAEQPITKGAQKKLIGIIEKLHEREQTLQDLNVGILRLSDDGVSEINAGGQIQSKMVNTLAVELKELIDTPLGPDRLDREKITVRCLKMFLK